MVQGESPDLVRLARDRVGLAALALALACAATPPREVADRCTPDAAFERGLADGAAGRERELGWLAACSPGGAALSDAYVEGHRAGVVEREAEAGQGSGTPYACEVQARGETFRGRGQSPAAAEAAARAACRARNGERFCGEVVCRPTE